MFNRSLGYEDITLIPRYSQIKTRKYLIERGYIYSDLFLKQENTRYKRVLPVISANMKTVTGLAMMIAMFKNDAVGILHRFYTNKEFTKEMENFKRIITNQNITIPLDISVGIHNLDFIDIIRKLELENYLRSVTIDIAHGHSFVMKKQINNLKEIIKTMEHNVSIIAGNVCTVDGFKFLADLGVDIVKCGIAQGSNCTTYNNTGFGRKMFSMLLEICNYRNDNYNNVKIIADGGIKNSSDIAKALSTGADAVMAGKMFAGHKECPVPIIEEGYFPNINRLKRYSGSASYETKLSTGQNISNIEGVSTYVKYKGNVKQTIQLIQDNLASSFSYAGVYSLQDFHKYVNYEII